MWSRALFLWPICFCLPCVSANPQSTQRAPLNVPPLLISENKVNDEIRALTSEQVRGLVERANADDVEAQCVLGAAYAKGVGVTHDDGEKP